MKSVQLKDGIGLAYTESGVGQPVIFLHPTPLDDEYWRLVIEKLHGIRAIGVHLRGHGGSGLGDLPRGGFALVPDAPLLAMSQMATDIVELMDLIGIEKATFAGCSIGGYVMLELWRQIPERIQGMAFVCSKPQKDEASNAERRARSIELARHGKMETMFDVNMSTLMSESSRLAHPERVAKLRSTMKLSVEGFAAVQAGLAIRPDSVPTVKTITAPVLAICGGKDPGIRAEEMQVFESAPGGCSFHLLPEAGHFAAYEEPEAVATEMQRWLEAEIFTGKSRKSAL